MKIRGSGFLIATSIALITLVLGCSSTGATTSTAAKTTATTSSTTTTTQNQTTTSTTTTTTTTSSNTLPTTAIAITTHSAAQLASYKGLCQMCHAAGLSNSNPYPPTWDGKASGSTVNTGKYTIVAGSPADHTNYTVDQCTQAGCHAAPGSSTTTPAATTTTPAPSTTTPVSTKAPKVIFDGSSFTPNKVSIVKGLVVTFDNPDHNDHVIVCVDSTGKNVFTQTLPESEETDCPAFAAAGVYTISDQANPNTKMTVTVV